MADTKLTALTAFTPVLTDVVYGVDDPAGTPVSGKVTFQSVYDLFFGELDASITKAKLAQDGATTGQAWVWNGTAWANTTILTETSGTALTTKSAPVAADEVLIFDSEDANEPKLVTGTNLAKALPVATTSAQGLMSTAMFDKLDGIAAGATVNSADATLLARANHTGTQGYLTVDPPAVVTLTDGATITPDLSAGRVFAVTLEGNRTLANPTNQVAGQSGRIIVKQDATGSRTLAYGADWNFPGGAPDLTTTASAVDIIIYDVQASGEIYATLIKDFS